MNNSHQQSQLKIFQPLELLGEQGFLHHRWKGKMYPPFIDPRAIEGLTNSWDTDEHDVFISTHQKVGTHLTKKFVVEILRLALEYPPGNPMATGDIGHHTVPWPEVMASQHGIDSFHEFLTRTAGYPRVWYTHCFLEDLPSRQIHPKSKFIVVIRDPRGAAVSQYFFYTSHPLLAVSPTLSMDLFVDMFVAGDLYFGDYHLHALGWIENKGLPIAKENLLVLQYEDLVEKKMEVASVLATFLVPGHNLTAAQLLQVANSTEFQTMKNAIVDNPGSFHFNPNTFFRSGQTTDWENHLSSAAVEAIDNKTRAVWGGASLTYPTLDAT
jgi:hypothetical protein